MSQIYKHTGTILPLDIANVDTDNIIPKQFLHETTRINFGKCLFFNWRFIENTNNDLNPKFILNQKIYKNANILLTRRNFGCGSSREHAVWALIDYGFKAIIAPSFADIFYKNSWNNHLLLINLSELEVDELFNKIFSYKKKISCTIHLNDQIIYIMNKQYPFRINNIYLHCILNKIDNISLTLQYDKAIKAYETHQLQFLK